MKPAQLDDLNLSRHRERRRGKDDLFVMAEQFRVEWEGVRVTVPKGFGTDLSSVPAIVPAFLARKIDGVEASVVHDFGYVSQENPKAWVDDLFFAMLDADPSVPGWRKWLMFVGVRIGGSYNKTEDPFVNQEDEFDGG